MRDADDYPGLVPDDDPPARRIKPVALAAGLPIVYDQKDIPIADSFFCGVCNTKHVAYSHSFNVGLAAILGRLFTADGPAPIADLVATKSEYTNCAKLRYWGLVVAHDNDASRRSRGWWEITDKGKAFVIGDITIQRLVWVRDDVVLRHEGPHITFNGVLPTYKCAAEYADTVRQELKAKNYKGYAT